MNMAEEYVLVERARVGDQGAFRELVNRYHRDVYRTVYSRIMNREDAEDITQETFIKALMALPQLESPHKFKQWIRRIAINTCINYVKRYNKLAEILEFCLPEEELALLRMIPAEEYQTWLTEAIQALSETSQRVIWLYYFEGLSYAEMAERVGVSVSTVRSRLHEARQQLQRLLKPLGPPLLKANFSSQTTVPENWYTRRTASEEDPRKYQITEVDGLGALQLVEYGGFSASLWTPVVATDFVLSFYVKATQPDASWCVSTHSRMSRSDFNDFGYEFFCLSYNGRRFELSGGRANHNCPISILGVNEKRGVLEDGQFHHYQVRRVGGWVEVRRDGLLLVSGHEGGSLKPVRALQLGGTGHFQGDGVGAWFDGLVMRGL